MRRSLRDFCGGVFVGLILVLALEAKPIPGLVFAGFVAGVIAGRGVANGANAGFLAVLLGLILALVLPWAELPGFGFTNLLGGALSVGFSVVLGVGGGAIGGFIRK